MSSWQKNTLDEGWCFENLVGSSDQDNFSYRFRSHLAGPIVFYQVIYCNPAQVG